MTKKQRTILLAILAIAGVLVIAVVGTGIWVVRSLVSRGLRATSSSLLVTLAREVFDRSTPFSADAGAALCVLAYACAGSSQMPGWLSAALRSYCLAPEGNPHVERSGSPGG